MSDSGASSGVKGGQAVVGTGQLGLGRDVDGISGGGTGRGRVGDGQDGDRDGLNRWEDIVANLILGTEHNNLLASTPGLEIHHLIMTMLGGHGGRLEREGNRESPCRSKSLLPF